MFREIDGRFKIVVEDNEDIRKLALRVLEGEVQRFLGVSYEDEALRLCEGMKESIHLILTDAVMPGMDGRELAQHLVGFIQR